VAEGANEDEKSRRNLSKGERAEAGGRRRVIRLKKEAAVSRFKEPASYPAG
jgi:hypothetical protein